MRKVLVTGGGGFLGTHIAKLLSEEDCEVYSFSRKSYDHLEELGIKHIKGDLTNLESVTQALEGMDVVFHVASLAGIWGEYDDFFKTNVMGTQNIIEACLKLGVESLVYTSTPSVAYRSGGIENVNESIGYPDTYKSDYAETKAIAERMVLDAASNKNLKTIALRPHLIWGPGDHHFLPRIIERAENDKLKLVGSGRSLVDHIYVENAAQAHLDAYKALVNNPEQVSGKAYFLSQDKPIKIKNLINKIFLNVAELEPIKKRVPFWLAYGVGAVLELIYKTFKLEGEPMMTRFVAEQFATPHWFDISAAKKDLGYEVKISTEEGIERLRAWYKEE